MIQPGLRMVFLILAVILALLAAPAVAPGAATSPPAVYTRVNLLALALSALALAFLFPG